LIEERARTVDANGAAVWSSELHTLCRDDEIGLRAMIAIDDATFDRRLGGVCVSAYTPDAGGIVEAAILPLTAAEQRAQRTLRDGRAVGRIPVVAA
jgi:leucine dehydrogenase